MQRLTNPMTVSELVLELFTDEQMTIKKGKVIEAAIELFSINGYMATTTKEIAKKAGVAEGTIFKHYQMKSDLLNTIIAKTVTLIKQNVQYYLLDCQYNSLEEFISSIVERSCFFVKRYYPVVKIFAEEVIFQRTIQEPLYKELFVFINERLKGMILQFREAGEIKELEPEAAQKRIVMTMLGLFTNSFLLLKMENPDESVIENTVDFLMDGLKARRYV
jgi:AcrR family transcriptional regulator